MKPSSLATVITRLAAIYMAVQAVILLVEIIGANIYLNAQIAEQAAPSEISGRIMNSDFPASGMFGVQLVVAGLLLAGGVVLYIFSRRLGNLIGGDLEQTPLQSIPSELQEWKEEAQKDIEGQVFRMYCVDWPEDKPLFDDVTGFPVELIDAPDTAEVRIGVAAYNAVMRNWFVNSQTS